MPACVGYGWAHWLDAAPYRQYLNPVGIYTVAQYFDEWSGTDYEGTSVRAGAKVLQLLGAIGPYLWAGNATIVANHILTKGPVVIGTNWYEGMDLLTMELTGPILGGHCYCLTGVNVLTGLFRVKNSWGGAGEGDLPFKVLNKLLQEGGEACVGVETQMRAT